MEQMIAASLAARKENIEMRDREIAKTFGSTMKKGLEKAFKSKSNEISSEKTNENFQQVSDHEKRRCYGPSCTKLSTEIKMYLKVSFFSCTGCCKK
jgi:hypothetical protein